MSCGDPPVPFGCTCRPMFAVPRYVQELSCPAHSTFNAVNAAGTTPQGWGCPRCSTIHAPHIDRCDCSAYGSTPGGSITITPVST